MRIPEALAEAAVHLASEINADAILALTDDGRNCDSILQRSFVKLMFRRGGNPNGNKIKFVVATLDQNTYDKLSKYPHVRAIKLTVRTPGRIGQVQHAISRGVKSGIFWPGELVVCLTGDGRLGDADTLFIHRVAGFEFTLAEMIESDPVLAAVVEIAMELGQNGYRGQPIGTTFMVGDSKAVLRRSRQLMLNPFVGHPPIMVTEKRDREVIKKYAIFDGAFVVDDDGRVLAAGRYLDANVEVDIPRGLGTRHAAAAAMTAATKAKGVTVSGEDGTVRIFERGELRAKIDPRSKILTEVGME